MIKVGDTVIVRSSDLEWHGCKVLRLSDGYVQVRGAVGRKVQMIKGKLAEVLDKRGMPVLEFREESFRLNNVILSKRR